MMLCGLWNKDRASCITEATLIETGVYWEQKIETCGEGGQIYWVIGDTRPAYC